MATDDVFLYGLTEPRAQSPRLGRVCPSNGVSGGFHVQLFSAWGMRSAKVIANGFRAGFQRMVHCVCPVPLGSSDTCLVLGIAVLVLSQLFTERGGAKPAAA